MKAKSAKRGAAKKAAKRAAPSPLALKSILVPLDFSEPSRRALDYPLSLADKFGAKLTLLHVVEPIATPDFGGALPLALEDDRLMDTAREELSLLVESSGIPPAKIEKTLVRFGRSFHEIADAARTRKVDLIVLATHGRTGLSRALLGSTAECVVRHAPCPVLVVRED